MCEICKPVPKKHLTPLIIAIAERMSWSPIDGVFVGAVEGAAITQPEWESDPEGCMQRVQGACEELAPAHHW